MRLRDLFGSWKCLFQKCLFQRRSFQNCSEPGRGHACRRWEREVYLAASQDVPPPASRAFLRHVARCPGCREELVRVRQLLLKCQELSSQPIPIRTGRLWPGIRSEIEAGAGVDSGVDTDSLVVPSSHSRPKRPMKSVALLVLFLGVVCWFWLQVGEVSQPLPVHAVWVDDWNDFVSPIHERENRDDKPANDLISGLARLDIPLPKLIEF